MAKGMRVVVNIVLFSRATLPIIAASAIQVPSQGPPIIRGCVGKESGAPLFPVSCGAKSRECRKKICGDGQRHNQR